MCVFSFVVSIETVFVTPLVLMIFSPPIDLSSFQKNDHALEEPGGEEYLIVFGMLLATNLTPTSISRDVEISEEACSTEELGVEVLEEVGLSLKSLGNA